MPKIKIFNMILFSFLTAIYPQNTDLSTALGFSAGPISGSGFSYRRMNANNGFQFTFGVASLGSSEDNYYDFPETYSGSYNSGWPPDTTGIQIEYDYGQGIIGSLGLTYYKPLYRAEKSRFYIMTGISSYYYYNIEYSRNYRYFNVTDSTYSYGPVGKVKNGWDFGSIVFGGIGFGFEWYFTENIRVSAEIPLTVSNMGDVFMYFPQAGLFYYYK